MSSDNLTKQVSIYTFIPLFLVLIVDAMGTGLVFPILSPIYMQMDGGILAATTTEAARNILYGITLAGFSFAMFFGAPLLGDLSDQMGRKKVLLICLIGTALSFLISAIGIEYKSVTLLIIGRFVGGFCAGSQPIAQAAITDISTDKNKAANLSLISAAFCVGFVIGPIMGGFFSDPHLNVLFSYSTPFFAATLLSFANAVLLCFTFKETFYPSIERKIDYLKGLRIFLSAFERKDIRLLVIVYFTWECAWTLYFQYMSLYLVHAYHFSAARIGLYMSLVGGIFAINMLVIVPMVVKKVKMESAIFAGLIMAFVGTAGGIFLVEETAQWLLAFPINIGLGLAYTPTLALFSNAVDKNSQGWIMGVIAAVVSMAWFLTGMALGPLASVNILSPFIVASLLLFASIIGMRIYIQKHSHS